MFVTHHLAKVVVSGEAHTYTLVVLTDRKKGKLIRLHKVKVYVKVR